MQERRVDKRRQLIFHLKVFDRKTGKQIGALADVSKEGLATISSDEIEVGQTFDLSLELPVSQDLPGTPLEFTARSQWSRPDANPDLHLTGFKVVATQEDHLRTIASLVRDFGFFDGEVPLLSDEEPSYDINIH